MLTMVGIDEGETERATIVTTWVATQVVKTFLLKVSDIIVVQKERKVLVRKSLLALSSSSANRHERRGKFRRASQT